jgi:hypothetical protein
MTRREVTVTAEETVAGRITGSNQPPIERGTGTTGIPDNFFAVLVAPSADVVDRQKRDLPFATARTSNISIAIASEDGKAD